MGERESLPEMVVPQGATTKAIMRCAWAMQEMRAIGWPKESIPELERLWWSIHDVDGNIKRGA